MRLSKPKTKAIYVTVTDAETRKSKSLTVYETTQDRFIEMVKGLTKAKGGAKSEALTG